MKIIKTKFFTNQVNILGKKYKNIEKDLSQFESILETEHGFDLGNSILKYRIKNSSIPTGKRGGFRLIGKIYGDTFIPLLMYSKTLKENVSDTDIILALEKVISEL